MDTADTENTEAQSDAVAAHCAAMLNFLCIHRALFFLGKPCETIVSNDKHDETAFKVIDRRLFNESGELRQDAVEREEAERKAAQAAPPAPAKPAAKPGGAGPAAGAAPAPDAPAAKEAPPPSQHFRTLVDFLVQNAAMFLGAYPDPRTGQAIFDLEGTREFIELLETLREKTQGNLAPEDEQHLTTMLGRLQLSYLEASKAAAKAMREQAGQKP